MASMRELTPTAADCEHCGTPASSSEASGRAARAISRLAGASRMMAQVNSAEAIRAASASAPEPVVTAGPEPPPADPEPPPADLAPAAPFPAGLLAIVPYAERRAAAPARTGTIAVVSAPPRT